VYASFKVFFIVFIALVVTNCFEAKSQSTTRATNIGYIDSKLLSGKINSTTIGEPIIQTNRTKSIVQTNGFLQPIGKFFLMSSSDNNSCLLWKIWPVPANESVNVYVSSTVDCKIKSYNLYIFNLLGQEITSKSCVEGINELDLTLIGSGVYYFKLITDSNIMVVQKVIVIH
jgi:hypothetical protein